MQEQLRFHSEQYLCSARLLCSAAWQGEVTAEEFKLQFKEKLLVLKHFQQFPT